MIYQIVHKTQYSYAEDVPLCHNIARLRPRNTEIQTCTRHELIISPTPSARSEHCDYFGNHLTTFSIEEPHCELSVIARTQVELKAREIDENGLIESWESVAAKLRETRDDATLGALQFTFDSPYAKSSDELADYARNSFSAGRPLFQAVFDLTQRIYRDFRFVPGATEVGTPAADVMKTREGVCQDFAHLEIACLRSFGLAARYISGYIVTQPPPGQPRLEGADASHAWLAVYFPSMGWLDFDPTNGVMPSDQHITLAWARDYDDVSPLKGIILGSHRHSYQITVDVS